MRGDTASGGGNKPAAATARPTPSPSNTDAPLTVAQIYQTVRPSVVLIRAVGGSSSAWMAPTMTSSGRRA